MPIEPQWIDYNGHLNMAYYNVLMDRSLDEFFAVLGIGPDYIKTRNCSTMTAECHVRYVREVHLGDPVQVSTQILGFDAKRLHTFETLRHATEGWISATSENLTLHIDMSVRRVAPFPPDIAATIASVAASHLTLPRPDGADRAVALAGTRQGDVKPA
jgi:acyl-CoA thioester hydrolase